jgi:hypothetical protein
MTLESTARRGWSRWQASGIHLLISAAIAAVAIAVMLLVWYPRPFFEAAGGTGLLFLLVGVDVVIGPVITLVIFRSGKRGLRFDLFVIGVLQIAALLYGGYVMFAARPVYLALVKGQFEMVTAVEVSAEELAKARRSEFRRLPLTGPRMVYSELTAEELREAVTSFISGGPDIHYRPQFYLPYDERRKEALRQAQPLDHARRAWPEAVLPIEAYLAEAGRNPQDIAYFSVRAPFRWQVALVDAKTGALLKFLPVPGR